MGSSFPKTAVLAEFDAILATFFPTRAVLTMSEHDFLALRAVVMVVIHVPMLGWVFQRVCVVRIYLSHLNYLHGLRL